MRRANDLTPRRNAAAAVDGFRADPEHGLRDETRFNPNGRGKHAIARLTFIPMPKDGIERAASSGMNSGVSERGDRGRRVGKQPTSEERC